jgi:hypothetical protein
MVDPISVRPTIPGGVGGPYPFNSNDVLVWKALICKYICKKNIEIFSKDDFYEALLNGEFPQGGAYVEPLRNATQSEKELFDNLLHFCLNSLSKKGLLGRSVVGQRDTEYRRTTRLGLFCPDIMKYNMFNVDEIVEPIIKVEEEIYKDKNFRAIITILKNLRETQQMNIYQMSSDIYTQTIHKLNQLGTIFLTLNGEITMSPIGRKVISDILASSASSKTKI